MQDEATESVETQASAGVSRRDFLRRAGKQAAKEVVTTGVKLVPGAALAQTLLRTNEEPTASGDTEATEGTGSGKQQPKSFLGKLASWRQKRQEEEKP